MRMDNEEDIDGWEDEESDLDDDEEMDTFLKQSTKKKKTKVCFVEEQGKCDFILKK